MEFWWRPFGLLAILAIAGFIVGFNWGLVAAWQFFAAILALATLHHLRQLHRLQAWLVRAEGAPPKMRGLWGELVYRLEKLLRKREKQRKKAQADLEKMLEATRSLPDGVLILDRDLRIDWMNGAAERFLGLSQQRDLGQFLVYLVRQSSLSEWLQTSEPGRPLTGLPSPDTPGGMLELQWVRLPRKQRMLIIRDVTEPLRVEAMRRDFVANVSHELRTPITVIAGFLETFEDMPDLDVAVVREHLPQLRTQSERMRRLIDDLLTLARLEGVSDPHEDVIEASALTARLLDEARGLSQGTHDVVLGDASPIRLHGSFDELYTACANLVTNAVRYTPPGGRIVLNWRRTDSGGAEFAVSDTGPGIEAQHIPRLTERFYRVDRGRSRASGGTGLGLAIVKHILQRHQGRLRIESTLGKGSCFAAVLPAARVSLIDALPAPLSDEQ